MSIYIKYTNDNWITNTKVTINPILDREISAVSKEIGDTLRGFGYSHKRYSKTKRLIKISADDLDTSLQKQKIRAIWTAGALKYSPDDVTYTDVILDKDGDYSPEYIDDDENLEEVELKLTYRVPD
ncbi:MAG: hypothetical protein WC121_10770 [Candidatus Kapaibacterium sp.]